MTDEQIATLIDAAISRPAEVEGQAGKMKARTADDLIKLIQFQREQGLNSSTAVPGTAGAAGGWGAARTLGSAQIVFPDAI